MLIAGTKSTSFLKDVLMLTKSKYTKYETLTIFAIWLNVSVVLPNLNFYSTKMEKK